MFSTNESTPRVAESQEIYLSHFLRSRLWYSWLAIHIQQVGPNLKDAGHGVRPKPAFKATKKEENKANTPRKMILHVLNGTIVMWQGSASLKWKTQPRNVRGLTSAHIVNHFWLYQNQQQGAFLSQEGNDPPPLPTLTLIFLSGMNPLKILRKILQQNQSICSVV